MGPMLRVQKRNIKEDMFAVTIQYELLEEGMLPQFAQPENYTASLTLVSYPEENR